MQEDSDDGLLIPNPGSSLIHLTSLKLGSSWAGPNGPLGLFACMACNEEEDSSTDVFLFPNLDGEDKFQGLPNFNESPTTQSINFPYLFPLMSIMLKIPIIHGFESSW